MKRTYRISPQARPALTDAEIARYRDPKRLLYNYQKASRMLHGKPLYKDPKAFLAILLIVLLAWFIAEVVEKKKVPPTPPQEQQHAN
jgi:hypothetical protein